MRWTPRPSELLLLLAALWQGCLEPPSRPRFEGAGATGPRRGGTVVIWEEQKVRSLDPHISFDVVSGMVIQMLYDPLLRYDQDTRLQPQLTTALPQVSADGKTFTLELKRGVRFTNGRELTAKDVVWSLERMLAPDTHSPGVPFFRALLGFEAYRDGKTSHVEGVRALDRYRVELRLAWPDQSFMHSLAMRFASPVPREAVQKHGKHFRERPVGLGPFRLVSWDPGVRLVLERNRDYHREGRPYLDRVVLEPGLKRETAFLRLLTGDVDIAQRITPPDGKLLERAAGWKPYLKRYARPDVYALFLNTQLAPFDNRHLRRAVAFALDRERWARVLTKLHPTGQILPPQLEGYDENLPDRQRFDLGRAREEMKLAGFPDGLPEPVTLWTTESADARYYSELAQQDLAKIGIQLKIKRVSFPVYLEETGQPRRAQMIAGGWLMDFPDPSNFMFLVHSDSRSERNSSNRSFYGNPTLDRLLNDALVETNHDKRIRMYREASSFIAREAPWAIFANTTELNAWQPYVRGYQPHPVYWVPLDNVWLDLPRKRVARARDPHGLGRAAAALSPLGAW